MKSFDAIVFDLDSTLVKIEGLDWLAEYKKKKSQVARLTKQSMDGKINFHKAMIEKMEIIRPTREEFEKLGNVYCKNIVEGAARVISSFHYLDKSVWILTGNFNPAVGILARKLDIQKKNVICNNVYFDSKGNYLGFNVNDPLAHNGGKIRKISVIKKSGAQKIAFVGDGITDLEVKSHVSMFVGFGGVVERKKVKEGADAYIDSQNLNPLLELLLNKKELTKLKYLNQKTNEINNHSWH